MRWIKAGFSWLVDQAIEHWPSIVVVSGGAVMAYLASVSQWLSGYGPVAWGSAGVATILVLAFAFFLFSIAKSKSSAASGKVPTRLRLQMNPGSSVAIEQQNIWYWYAITFLREKHFNKKKEVERDVPGHLLFIVFDKPVAMKQPIIECAGAALPFYEEKSRSDRHLVVDLTDAVSGKIVNVSIALLD
jgi:hypothetical protein